MWTPIYALTQIPFGETVVAVRVRVINHIQRFLPEASFGLRVLSLPASVCLCVRLCVHQSRVFRGITHHSFKLWSLNLDHRRKRSWLRSLLFEGRLTLTFKVKFNSKVKIYPIWACPCHNSPPIEVTISKFGTKMHLSTVQIPTKFWAWLKLIFNSIFNFKHRPNWAFYVPHWQLV